MKVYVNCEGVRRGRFELNATGQFGTGTHMISGRIGSGKSTLALAIAGEMPEKGVMIHKEGIESVLLSFQFPEYHVTRSSVSDEIASWGLDENEVIRTVGLIEKSRLDPLRLSRGELKRLEVGCILERDPDLLILDEPFASLDCMWKQWLCERLNRRRKRNRGVTLIFSHERMQLPEADEIWKMETGSLTGLGRVPVAISKWESAPDYIIHALRAGAEPENITMKAAEEALCRMQG